MKFKIDDLGNFLKSKRKERSLTITYVANGCDVSPGYISRIEKNSSTPSLETLMRLSEILGFELESIVDTRLDLNKTYDIVDLLKTYRFTYQDRVLSKFEAEKIIDTIQAIYDMDWNNETDKYFGVTRILCNIKDIRENCNEL